MSNFSTPKHLLHYSFILLLSSFLIVNFAYANKNDRKELCKVQASDDKGRPMEVAALLLEKGYKNGVYQPVIKITQRQGRTLNYPGSLFKNEVAKKRTSATAKLQDHIVIWKANKNQSYTASAIVSLKGVTRKPDQIKLSLQAPGSKTAKTASCPYPWK